MSCSSTDSVESLSTARQDPDSPHIEQLDPNVLYSYSPTSTTNHGTFDYDNDNVNLSDLNKNSSNINQVIEGENPIDLVDSMNITNDIIPVDPVALNIANNADNPLLVLYQTYFGFNGLVQLILTPFFQGLFYGLGEASAKIGIGLYFEIDPIISLCGLPFNTNKEHLYKVKYSNNKNDSNNYTDINVSNVLISNIDDDSNPSLFVRIKNIFI